MKTELYSVIKSPYLTEKVSSLMGESNQYAFKVDINATKLQVKKAVEGYFSVNVEDVNIIKGIVEAQKDISKDQADDTRKAREKKKRSMKENLLEGTKGAIKKVGSVTSPLNPIANSPITTLIIPPNK